MQKNYESQKESMTLDIVSLVLAQLEKGKQDRNPTPDLIAKAIVSTSIGHADHR